MDPTEEQATGEQQPQSAADGGAPAADTAVSIPKEELEQLRRDRDTYREGLLALKAKERSLKAEAPAAPSAPAGSGAIDEERVRQIAAEASSRVFASLEQSNEQRAKLAFLRRHQEYADDAAWAALVSEYAPRRGRVSADDIIEDLEDAAVVSHRKAGKLDEYLQRERARQTASIEASAQRAVPIGTAGAQPPVPPAAETLSATGQEMARKMRLDPKKVEASLKLGNTIDLGAR